MADTLGQSVFGSIKVKDSSGALHIMYPATTADQVIYDTGVANDGIDDTVEAALDAAVKSVGLSGTTVTVTKLDGSTSTFSIPDTYTHPAYSAQTGKPTGNQTPGFGSSFTVSQITSDATGHVTGATDRSVKIPDTKAASNALGLVKIGANVGVDSNGVISVADGASGTAGVVQLSDATDGTSAAASGKTAATPKAVSDALAAAKSYADGLVTSAMHYKGTVGTGGTVTSLPTASVSVGDTYRVITAGSYANQDCEVGDMIIALTDDPTWTVVQNNVDVFSGATSSAAGSIGMVPAPSAGDQNKVLSGAGTWVTNTGDTLVTQNVSTANEEHPILLTVTKDAAANQGAKTAIFAAGVKVNPSTGTVTATTFSGSLSGNASSATEFSASKTVQLTGDVTGSASSKAGWSVATTLANSGADAGSYGDDGDTRSLSHSGTFKVPYVTVDAKGRVTSISTKTLTLPASGNTDTKVTQTADSSSTDVFPILAKNTKATSTVTDTARFAAAVTLKPSTGTLSATNLAATSALSGATLATTGNATVGGNLTVTGTFSAGNIAANSVANSLILKVKSGSTEGTDLYTFNGSAAKTLNILQGTNVTLTAGEGTLTIAAADTHHQAKNIFATTSSKTSAEGTSNTNTFLNLVENSSVRSGLQIQGTGTVSVSATSAGVLTITGTDTNTHYTAVPVLGSASNATSNATSATANASTYLNIAENGAVSGYLQVKGAGTTTVSANSGVLTITGESHYTAKNVIGASSAAQSDAATTNTTTYLNLVENSTVRSSHQLKGTGWTAITATSGGVISVDTPIMLMVGLEDGASVTGFSAADTTNLANGGMLIEISGAVS